MTGALVVMAIMTRHKTKDPVKAIVTTRLTFFTGIKLPVTASDTIKAEPETT
jgi:hypothetical protein